MKHYTLILISILLLLCGRVNAQYEGVTLYMEVSPISCLPSFKLNISMFSNYCDDCKGNKGGYNIYVGVSDYENIAEQRVPEDVVDTIFKITRQEYNLIMKHALAISSHELIEHTDISTRLISDVVGMSSSLTLSMFDYSISYSLSNVEKKEGLKHLSNYLYVYKELERLTGGDFDNGLLFGFQDIAIKK